MNMVFIEDNQLMKKVNHDDMERWLGKHEYTETSMARTQDVGIGAIGTPNEPNDPYCGHLLKIIWNDMSYVLTWR